MAHTSRHPGCRVHETLLLRKDHSRDIAVPTIPHARRKKRESVRKGNVHLVTALVQAGVCAGRKKDTYLRAKYWKLVPRIGKQRTAIAIGHKFLTAAYYMLKNGVDYHDLGHAYLDKRAAKATSRALVKRLEEMGYKVTLDKVA